jgi:hypothetical protein
MPQAPHPRAPFPSLDSRIPISPYESPQSAQASLAAGVKDISLSKLTATRALKADAPVLGKRDCDLEVSHDLTSSESKLKLSTVLGSGLTAIGSLTSKGSASKLAYEVEYDTTLGEGRTLSATVSPADGMPTHPCHTRATLALAPSSPLCSVSSLLPRPLRNHPTHPPPTPSHHASHRHWRDRV